ncbi:MAG: hypothetical protein WD200_05235 [Candidatus Andersenbacteria bacterium]
MANTGSLNSAYLILTGVIVVTIIIIFVLIRPLMADIDVVKNSLQAKQIELTERQQFLQTIDNKLAALQVQQEHEARLQVMLPDEQRVEDVLRILHEASASSGLVINAARNTSSARQSRLNSERARGGRTTIPADVQVLGFSINITTSYQQLRTFVTELERSLRLIDVHNISLKQSDIAPDVLAGQLELVFYMQESSALTVDSL